MPLSKQGIVDKLDTIPTFHLENTAHKIFPIPDESGEKCIRWYVDVDDAQSALVMVQALNPEVPLQLGVTPLGTAFALSQGWQPNEAPVPLRLHASKAVLMALAEERGQEPAADAFPLYGCEELTSARVMPFWTNAADVKETWLSAGRPPEAFPTSLTVVDLRKLVQSAMSDDHWSTLMLIASSKAITKAQELQEMEETRVAAGLGEEPPPLESA